MIGRIVNYQPVERIMKDGNIKNVLIVTLMDERVHIDAMFWDHHNIITMIAKLNYQKQYYQFKELPSISTRVLSR